MRLTRWIDGEREAPEPLEGNVVAVVTGGTVVWFALFLGQLPFYRWYADRGHDWWIWTCLVGGALGLLGLVYVRRREAALRRAARSSDHAAADDDRADGGAAPEPPHGA